MRHSPLLAALAVGAPLGIAAAQQPTYKRDVPDSLLRRATITEARAASVAQHRYPTGRIQALELENEDGRLIYSFELKIPHRSGIQEVNVNARSGKIVNIEHESGAIEAREAAAEKHQAAHKPVKKP